jgi:hypothetical protein
MLRLLFLDFSLRLSYPPTRQAWWNKSRTYQWPGTPGFQRFHLPPPRLGWDHHRFQVIEERRHIVRDFLFFANLLETIESQENREIWHGFSRLLPCSSIISALIPVDRSRNFQVSNYPQVCSQDTMVMLDPQGDFFNEGKKEVKSEDVPTEIRDSLNLAWFQGNRDQGNFPGTVIRLPLRSDRHRAGLSSKTVSYKEIEDHFEMFAQMEMDICLLFLSSLQSVEFWIIREGENVPSRVAFSNITPVVDASNHDIAVSRRVETKSHTNPSDEKIWLVRWYSVPNSEAQDQLSTWIGWDVRSTVEREKLMATVALAIQIDASSEGCLAPGRLFTYLPLPSGANYPCNIHAPFALTADRQSLRNEQEEGLIKGSDDQYVFSHSTSIRIDRMAASASSGIDTSLTPSSPSPGPNFYSTFPGTTPTHSQRGRPQYAHREPVPIGRSFQRELLSGLRTIISPSGPFKALPFRRHTADTKKSLLLHRRLLQNCWRRLPLSDWSSLNLRKIYTTWFKRPGVINSSHQNWPTKLSWFVPVFPSTSLFSLINLCKCRSLVHP